MRLEPGNDHLELWRGIDDAVWREALRAPPAPMARRIVLTFIGPSAARTSGHRPPGRAPQAAAQKVPEPA